MNDVKRIIKRLVIFYRFKKCNSQYHEYYTFRIEYLVYKNKVYKRVYNKGYQLFNMRKLFNGKWSYSYISNIKLQYFSECIPKNY